MLPKHTHDTLSGSAHPPRKYLTARSCIQRVLALPTVHYQGGMARLQPLLTQIIHLLYKHQDQFASFPSMHQPRQRALTYGQYTRWLCGLLTTPRLPETGVPSFHIPIIRGGLPIPHDNEDESLQ